MPAGECLILTSARGRKQQHRINGRMELTQTRSWKSGGKSLVKYWPPAHSRWWWWSAPASKCSHSGRVACKYLFNVQAGISIHNIVHRRLHCQAHDVVQFHGIPQLLWCSSGLLGSLGPDLASLIKQTAPYSVPESLIDYYMENLKRLVRGKQQEADTQCHSLWLSWSVARGGRTDVQRHAPSSSGCRVMLNPGLPGLQWPPRTRS
jgi:hypothetical protein